MMEITNYVSTLLERSVDYLRKEYKIEQFRLSNFQLLNFFLIDRALNHNQNLFIESFDKNMPSMTQFPTVLSTALSLFYKNYCDDLTTYELGEILQKDGVRYEVVGIKDNKYQLKTNFKGGFIKEVQKKVIKRYIVTNTDLSKRKVKTRFDNYKTLFNSIYGTEYVPSKFNYKSVIILEKKEFDNEIKNQTYIDIDILKAIPIRWISKNGNESWNYIPIEPMILCVPDFETMEEHILEKGIKIESLIVIGRNKYRANDLTKIKRYLREGAIPNCIILGNEGFEDNGAQFIKWRWTYREFAFLEQLPLGRIDSIQVEDSGFETAINDFQKFLNELESKYFINLTDVKTLRKFLYPLVLSKEFNSRSLNQLNYVHHLFKKVSRERIIESFHNHNVDAGKKIEEVEERISEIFQKFENNKLDLLNNLDSDIIIVPEPLLLNWQQEYKSRAKIISFKLFFNRQSDFKNIKRVVVLSLFGNGFRPLDVVKHLLHTKHYYKFLCYQEESEILRNLLNQYSNENIKECTSIDREKITGVKYPIQPIQIEVSDLIESIHDKSLKESKEYYYEESEQINYEIEFEDTKEMIISDGSKNVLLYNENTWIKSKVSNLIQNDRVIIYNNLSKEKLFDIAAQQDSEGRFTKVDNDSKIWKSALLKFFNRRVDANLFYSELDLMDELRHFGLTITNPFTIKKWLTADDKEKFPNSSKDLIAIKKLLNDPVLNKNFESIKRSKRFYRGVMISLGRDLSEDVMEYIFSKRKYIGKVLSKFTEEEIKVFIKRAAPERIIKKISITEEDESI